MQNTAIQSLSLVGAQSDRRAHTQILQPALGTLSTQALISAGLVIKAAAATVAKTGAAAFYAVLGGRLLTIAAATDMPALTGLTITANSFNVACFFVNSSGTVSMSFGTEGTSLGRVKFPDFPLGQALVGFLIITHSATFTGGTTALDTATTVYVSPTGAVDPTILFS